MEIKTRLGLRVPIGNCENYSSKGARTSLNKNLLVSKFLTRKQEQETTEEAAAGMKARALWLVLGC